MKTLNFLGFFDSSQKLDLVDSKGKQRSYLDVLGDVLGKKLAMEDNDRDLVVMRHYFKLEDKDGNRWTHTSTMLDSGASKNQGGITLMSKTVGITTAIATRMVLDGEVKHIGVLSPIYPDIYNPILKKLEKHGVVMIEESERPTINNRSKL